MTVNKYRMRMTIITIMKPIPKRMNDDDGDDNDDEEGENVDDNRDF